MAYKYDNIFEFVQSLDDIILPAKEKYESEKEIADLIKKIIILGEQEINNKNINYSTYRSSIIALIMQRYFLNDTCTKRVKWFPELIKFKNCTIPLEVDNENIDNING